MDYVANLRLKAVELYELAKNHPGVHTDGIGGFGFPLVALVYLVYGQ